MINNLHAIKDLILSEPKVAGISGKVVFVGDTHGDLDASRKVFELYPDHTKVFTGDYVDRGICSKENIDFLLEQKLAFPDKVVLLVGNHEAYPVIKCYPNDFWESLTIDEFQFYSQFLPSLPYMAYGNGIVALHGVPPDIHLENIHKIEVDSLFWFNMIWGDFIAHEKKGKLYENNGDVLGKDISGRPRFGKKYFERSMKKLNADILIRSHQPDVPLKIYDGRCYTIFTSSEYLDRRPARTVIVADLDNRSDFEIVEI